MLQASGEHSNVPDDRNDRTAPAKGLRKHRPNKAFEQIKSLLSRKRLRRGAEITEDHILSILIARRGREAALGANLFSEPAWDVLLELYAAKLGARNMSLADLARAIGAPESTTERWIAVLNSRDLVGSEKDQVDPGRLWIKLTELGASKMKSLTDHWGAAFLSI